MNAHFFLDCYEVNEELLASVDNMKYLLTQVNKKYFNGAGNIILIPYFCGKVKADGGISGIILGNNCHFTCHTFCSFSANMASTYISCNFNNISISFYNNWDIVLRYI